MAIPSVKRGALGAVGFVVTLGVGVSVPLILFAAAYAAEENPGTWLDLVAGRFGSYLLLVVWLVVVASGVWLGIRHSDKTFFRGAFLGSFIVIGCLVILIAARLLGGL